MLKPADVIDVNPAESNFIVAPVTAAKLVAVKLAKVAVPLIPATPATEFVPPIVHEPEPTIVVTVAVLVVVLLY
jgi:hypothetical protein